MANYKKKRQSNNNTPMATLFVMCLAIILGIYSSTRHAENQNTNSSIQSNSKNGNAIVHFLDVDQGNATLIESNGHYMLIDGGNKKTSSYVVAYLKEQGVTSLDYIIASHYDSDHISGLIGVLKNYKVDTVLNPNYEADTKTYASYENALKENGATIICPKQNSTYEFDDCEFTVVCPYTYTYTNENDNSVGIRFVCGDTSFLILGDASEQSESDMEKTADTLKSDVYLMSHHGSRHSSTTDFLKMVSPSYVVISCGEGNDYSHPHEDALNRLKSYDIDLYRTDKQGAILATTDGSKITFSVEPCNDYTPGN